MERRQRDYNGKVTKVPKTFKETTTVEQILNEFKQSYEEFLKTRKFKEAYDYERKA